MARICDCGDCPANALHDIVVHGQDFHFCGHHWAELEPALRAAASSWGRVSPDRTEPAASDPRSGLLLAGRRRSGV